MLIGFRLNGVHNIRNTKAVTKLGFLIISFSCTILFSPTHCNPNKTTQAVAHKTFDM